MAVIIRNGTAADAQAIAKLVLLAAKSHLDHSSLDYSLPGTEEYQLEVLQKLALATEKTYVHHSLFTLLEVDGQVCAGIAGFDYKEVPVSAINDALREIGWNPSQIEEMHQRIETIGEEMPEFDEGVWTLEHCANLPNYRTALKQLIKRQEVFNGTLMDILFKAIITKGVERGFKRIQADILIGNTAIEKVMERHGFKLAEEYRSARLCELLGCAGIARMRLDV